MATQVSGASAAGKLAGSRPLAPVATAAWPGKAVLRGFASLVPSPPTSGGWTLLVAGLVGVWAIGQRRISAHGSHSLDPGKLPRR
jgi:hypothetical protein